MACPYFYPLLRHPAKSQALSLPLPLGDAWSGVCHAASAITREPEAAVVDSLCSLGYARGHCSQFGENDPGPDAVRFTISRDSGASLDVYYVLERDHHPFAHGRLHYSVTEHCFPEAPVGETMVRQANAYVESYLSRRALLSDS